MSINRLILGDNLEILKSMENDSVILSDSKKQIRFNDRNSKAREHAIK